MRQVNTPVVRCAALCVIAIGATLVFAFDWESPVRTALVLIFLLFVPGLALAELLELRDSRQQLALATGASLAVEIVAGLALLYAGAFSTSRTLAIVVGVTLLASVVTIGRSYLREPDGTASEADAGAATALGRAGGSASHAELTFVNVAGRAQDEQQIVPVAGGGTGGTGADAAAVGGATANANRALAGAKIHLSTATVEQLDEILGIGRTLAERIVEYRDAHGGFRSLEELAEVDGIGESRLAALRDALQR